VARADDPDARVTLRDYQRLKGRLVALNHRGLVVLRAWPRKRGPRKTALQQAWVNKFKSVALAVKTPTPQDLELSQLWAKGTGWYYRDVLTTAAYGKLFRVKGETRIQTPTCFLTGTAYTSCPSSTPTPLPLSDFDWNNNDFWAVSPNPTRITFRAAGLYMYHAGVQFNGAGQARNCIVNPRLNGSEFINQNNLRNWLADQAITPTTDVWYFHAGDYLEILASVGGLACTAKLSRFWALAITPESLIP